MQVFIHKPSVDLYPGIKVEKDTVLEYKNEHVYDTTIQLQEGDVLVFEEEGRGYVKPVESFVTVAEAIEELSCIKDLG